jgi:hypothetical protein
MSLARCLPALFAGLLICLLPSCASIPDGLLEATAAHAREQSRPALDVKLKPVVDGAPTCITRGAGMDFDPPSCGDGMWVLGVFYLLVYLGYAIGWSFVALGELIYEACAGDEETEEEPEEPAEE